MGLFGCSKHKKTSATKQDNTTEAPADATSGVAEEVAEETLAEAAPEDVETKNSPEQTDDMATRLQSGPYTSSEEHLWDALCRIDQLVRAQTVRWRRTIADHKPENLWGMVCVTDAEVKAYLRTPFYPPTALPAALRHALEGYWERAQTLDRNINERMVQTPENIVLRLKRLQTLFGLSALECDILLVCLLSELDARYRRLYGYLMDDASRTRPTLELVWQILYPCASRAALLRSACEKTAPLISNHLLVKDGTAGDGEVLSMSALKVDDRIVDYLLENETIDARLAKAMSHPTEPVAWDRLIVTPEHIARLQALAENWLHGHGEGGGRAVVFLLGRYGSGRLKAAQAICTATETPLLVVDAVKALNTADSWAPVVDLAYREAALLNAALYWSTVDTLLDEKQPPARWEYLTAKAEGFQGLTFLASRTFWNPAGRFHKTPFLRLAFRVPDYHLRRTLWETYLPPADEFGDPTPDRAVLVELLANGFQLTEGQIQDAVAAARWQALQRNPENPQITGEGLHEGCRRQSGRRLATMARRIEPRTELTFDDLVILETSKRQLDELRQRIRLRGKVYTGMGFEQRLSLGKGLIALFTGSSGTGKTMAGELLAREQGVDLYKVDLSAVVSKYVGETEKNLSRVFAEAEDANAIIFFDEADALFGKRGEVKEAQDRWANMEVNYLLQRVEEYAGVVILTSNLRQNIDEAFMRRIHVIVEFPFPDADARLRILSGMFPSNVRRPPDDDLRQLAEKFKLSGGSFKNIVVDAAFRALAGAKDESPEITLRHLAIATAREYQKLGKPLTKSEFGKTFYAWVEEDIL